MGRIAEENARRLLQDPQLADAIIRGLSKDPDVLADIADELADVLEDAIEADDGLRGKILTSISRNKAFLRRMSQQVAQNSQ